ncbi:MAG TPA: IclR family transcriptional regulator C-terminal domain-containing protein, partial [Thermotogota bacterium]|nr:IclR family transcriptional regulator C-terminal domain-containing protein [Thermotogota bacterium]
AGHCSSENLQKRLELIREEGYAFCDNEYEPGLQALAVPVFNEDKEVKVSITAIAPGTRFSNNQTRVRIVEALKKSAHAIKSLI